MPYYKFNGLVVYLILLILCIGLFINLPLIKGSDSYGLDQIALFYLNESIELTATKGKSFFNDVLRPIQKFSLKQNMKSGSFYLIYDFILAGKIIKPQTPEAAKPYLTQQLSNQTPLSKELRSIVFVKQRDNSERDQKEFYEKILREETPESSNDYESILIHTARSLGGKKVAVDAEIEKEKFLLYCINRFESASSSEDRSCYLKAMITLTDIRAIQYIIESKDTALSEKILCIEMNCGIMISALNNEPTEEVLLLSEKILSLNQSSESSKKIKRELEKAKGKIQSQSLLNLLTL